MNICPFCRHQNNKGVADCAKCGQRMYSEPQTEWSSHINQVAQGYRQPPAIGITHGVQKDALQNAWGARRSRHGKGKWGAEFALVNDRDKTKYLTVTDWGTYGLTGRVYDDPEAIPDELPPDERLARFENMNFSGGNSSLLGGPLEADYAKQFWKSMGVPRNRIEVEHRSRNTFENATFTGARRLPSRASIGC